MKASELLGRPVWSADDRCVGVVHDVRVELRQGPGSVPVVRALVVGPETRRCRIAHAWGYAQGRTTGPWPLRRVLAPQRRRTARVLASEVQQWDDLGRIRLAGAVAEP